MKSSVEKKIIPIKECDLQECNNDFSCIAKVYFDNDYEPILLASDSELDPLDCSEYIKELGMEADKNYRIDYLKGTKIKTNDNKK